MIASYDGRCTLCDRRILADIDEIVRVDDEWVHVECAEDEGLLDDTRRPKTN